MRVHHLVAAMEKIAPSRYAESWDNVGLLCGEEQRSLARVLLTIDLTPAVLDEAVAERCDAVVAYHPPIFQGLKRVTGDLPVFQAIRHGIAVYSPHTAWDAAKGGVNDALADALWLTDARPLRLSPPRSTHCKLITFAPHDKADAVADAIFDAGAGVIGNYSKCSFRSAGTGTFVGNEQSNPTVGEAGRLERTEEVRIETLVPLPKLEAVVAAMRAAHPYEEPAFDLVPLSAEPTGLGIGRVGTFSEPVERDVLIARVKRELHLDHVLVAGPDGDAVSRVALCAGAGDSLIEDVLREKAEVYVTGELRHHDALRLAKAGVTSICLLHSNSERHSLGRLAERLREELPKLTTVLSKRDRDPFAVR
jgi:dinuclear metal center YbgI/SA1388 family protein